MATSLTDKRPILVTDSNGKKELLPLPELFSKFDLLHYFLDETLEDWKRASLPYQSKIDSSSENSDFPALAAYAFLELQPIFLKCVFSYAMFFVAADSAYNLFYSQLNRANNISGLHVKHKKPPKKNATIKKLKMVRDWSIVHIGSQKASEVDKLSAISWRPISWRRKSDESWDVNELTFGAFQRIRRDADGTVLAKSQDIELPGLPDLHDECKEYFEKFDEVCTEYLDMLHIVLSANLVSH